MFNQIVTRLKPAGTAALVTVGLYGAFALGAVFSAPAHQVNGQAVVDPETALLTGLYKQVNPSVVSITVRIPNTVSSPDYIPPVQNGGTPIPFQTGDASGFVYSKDGYIVTNAHVVQDADRVEITFADDITVKAAIVGIDPDSDLAVLKVVTDASRLVPLTLANSDQVQIGQRTFAIGNPFGYSNSMTTGIVSGLKRALNNQNVNNNQSNLQIGFFQIPNMIQTDTAINPGNSGGPLVNFNGEVIGVNTLIESRVGQSSGVGFALPSNLIKHFADLLIKNGKVAHTFLGIRGGSLSTDINELIGLDPNLRGVLVNNVTLNSPADKAGILPGTTEKLLDGDPVKVDGDIITAIDGQPVHRFEDIPSYLFSSTDVGQTITLSILRAGKPIEVKVTLVARPN
jgi:S1-C subfamily serine protease